MTQENSTEQPTPSANVIEWPIPDRWTGVEMFKIAGSTFREALQEALRAGKSFRGSDLSGSNLSGSKGVIPSLGPEATPPGRPSEIAADPPYAIGDTVLWRGKRWEVKSTGYPNLAGEPSARLQAPDGRQDVAPIAEIRRYHEAEGKPAKAKRGRPPKPVCRCGAKCEYIEKGSSTAYCSTCKTEFIAQPFTPETQGAQTK